MHTLLATHQIIVHGNSHAINNYVSSHRKWIYEAIRLMHFYSGHVSEFETVFLSFEYPNNVTRQNISYTHEMMLTWYPEHYYGSTVSKKRNPSVNAEGLMRQHTSLQR